MQTYILILIGILVLLLIGVVYFGWRKIINLEIESNKNKYDIEALRGLLSKLLDGDEIEMNPSFFKKEKPYNIQMNASELKNQQFGGADADEDESEVETLHSSDDEEEIPEDESTVSIENIEDEDDSDEDDSDEDEEDEDEDSDDSDDSEEDDDDSEEDEESTSEKEENEVEKESFHEPEVKEIKHEEEKTEDKQENNLEEEDKTEIKVVEVEKKKEDEVSVNKNVKKIPSESLKNYKSGDVVVSKNDGNKYKVVMYKNQKKWKLIDE